jgi:hypothetical protein
MQRTCTVSGTELAAADVHVKTLHIFTPGSCVQTLHSPPWWASLEAEYHCASSRCLHSEPRSAPRQQTCCRRSSGPSPGDPPPQLSPVCLPPAQQQAAVYLGRLQRLRGSYAAVAHLVNQAYAAALARFGCTVPARPLTTHSTWYSGMAGECGRSPDPAYRLKGASDVLRCVLRPHACFAAVVGGNEVIPAASRSGVSPAF